MKLTVLNVAYPLASVGPNAVGGAEQVLSHLDRALVAEGHNSLVIASEDSQVAGTLYPVPCFSGMLDPQAKRRAAQNHVSTIHRVLAAQSVHVMHFHGIDFYEYLPEVTNPALVTLHLPVAWYPHAIFKTHASSVYLHGVSDRQMHDCPPCSNVLPSIPNGVDLSLFGPCTTKQNYAIALGRICPEKGFHIAIEAAKQANSPLLLAGRLFAYPSHKDYFEAELAPRLDKSRRFIGPIGVDCKRQLLSAARCLLVPSLAPETSSLVAMEALACGTPVIAFAAGALADIVEHGVTGFLVNNTEQMAEAILKAGAIHPEACRNAAEQRFSATNMTKKYFALYQAMAQSYSSTAKEDDGSFDPGKLDAGNSRGHDARRLGSSAR